MKLEGQPCRDCGEICGRDSAKGRCGTCYQSWRRAGFPRDRVSLKASDSGYGAYGIVRLDVAVTA